MDRLIIFRADTRTELEQLVPLFLDNYSSETGKKTSEEEALAVLQELHDSGIIIAASRDDAVVGFFDGKRVEGTRERLYSLGWLYVSPNHRRGGVGTALVEAHIRYAQEQRFARIGCQVAKGNHASLSLSEKFGFKIYREFPSDYVLMLDL